MEEVIKQVTHNADVHEAQIWRYYVKASILNIAAQNRDERVVESVIFPVGSSF